MELFLSYYKLFIMFCYTYNINQYSELIVMLNGWISFAVFFFGIMFLIERRSIFNVLFLLLSPITIPIISAIFVPLTIVYLILKILVIDQILLEIFKINLKKFIK